MQSRTSTGTLCYINIYLKESHIYQSGYSAAITENVTAVPVVLGLRGPNFPARHPSRSLSAYFANWHVSAYSLDRSLIMHLRLFVFAGVTE